MFSYWGRQGALTQFTFEIGQLALARPGLSPTISVSKQNEAFSSFAAFGPALLPIDTFSYSVGAILATWRLTALRRAVVSRLRTDRCRVLIELMPHVWSPLVMPAVKRSGVRYITTIHDADAHPGDHTGLVNDWLLQTCRQADRVVTLSDSVANRLLRRRLIRERQLSRLFLPNLTYGVASPPPTRSREAPFRLMFLGRIMPYKGLALFVDMAEQLRARGVSIDVGVFGAGDMSAERERLERLDAEISNHWLSEDELVTALSRYHAVVVSHIEASQSGVIAAAFGAGRPVIVTPVGGLIEQVRDRLNGMIVDEPSGRALASAVSNLVADPTLYETLVHNIAAESATRSMDSFLDQLLAVSLD